MNARHDLTSTSPVLHATPAPHAAPHAAPHPADTPVLVRIAIRIGRILGLMCLVILGTVGPTLLGVPAPYDRAIAVAAIGALVVHGILQTGWRYRRWAAGVAVFNVLWTIASMLLA